MHSNVFYISNLGISTNFRPTKPSYEEVESVGFVEVRISTSVLKRMDFPLRREPKDSLYPFLFTVLCESLHVL